MKSPLVSIIIPIYNGNKYLYKTVKSCVSQTHKNIEILLRDDKSTDNSYKVIEEFIDNKKVFYKTNEKNLGVLKTCNNAVDECNGEYIIFLGQDDVLKDTHVEKMLQSFTKSTAIVFCNSILIDSNDNEIGDARKGEILKKCCKDIQFYLGKDNYIPSTGLMLKKEFFNKVGGFDTTYKNYGEWLLWIKLSLIGEIKYNDKIVCFYRRHETNMTNSFANIEVQKKLNKYFNKCRKYILINSNLNIAKKIYILIRYVYLNLKFLVKCILK